MEYVSAFIVGGLICVAGQILMDTTKLTPARILVIFVTVGAVLGAFGIYDKLVDIGGAGATIPLPSFGNSLAKAAIQAVQEDGLLGAFTGGILRQKNSLIKKLIYFKKILKPFIITFINGYYFKRSVTFERILSEKLDKSCRAFRQ